MKTVNKNDVNVVLELLESKHKEVLSFQERLTQAFLTNFSIDQIQTVEYFHKTYELSELALEFIEKRIKHCKSIIKANTNE